MSARNRHFFSVLGQKSPIPTQGGSKSIDPVGPSIAIRYLLAEYDQVMQPRSHRSRGSTGDFDCGRNGSAK
jgi:hypothetical protein